MNPASYVVVIPTIGRASLRQCLESLAAAARHGNAPSQVVLADDRPDTPEPLPAAVPGELAGRTVEVTLDGGFDERFPRAYREDSDLALRVLRLGWRLREGSRRSSHPVPPPSAWASLRAQRGNADDAAMRRQHGRGWQRRAGASTGRRPAHVAVCALGASGLLLAAAGRAMRGRAAAGPAAGRAAGQLAACCATGWFLLTAEFAGRRVLAGSRTWREAGVTAVTSVLIPPLAVWHWTAGAWRNRNAGPWPPARPAGE